MRARLKKRRRQRNENSRRGERRIGVAGEIIEIERTYMEKETM